MGHNHQQAMQQINNQQPSYDEFTAFLCALNKHSKRIPLILAGHQHHSNSQHINRHTKRLNATLEAPPPSKLTKFKMLDKSLIGSLLVFFLMSSNGLCHQGLNLERYIPKTTCKNSSEALLSLQVTAWFAHSLGVYLVAWGRSMVKSCC